MEGAIFHHLTIFHAIAAEGSITGAARRLELGVPAISKSLKALEARAGLPLFHRTTRKLEITEAGQMLRERTQDAVRQLDYAFESVQDLGQLPSGTVRITMARFAYQWVLRPVLAAFYEAYPHIQLEISISDGTIDMIAEGFDLGIRFGDRLEEGMIARRLMPAMREGLYVSPAYALRHGIPATPQDLRNHRLIGYRFITANRMLPLIVDQDGDELAIDMPSPIVTNDIEVTADAIRQGLGIGRLFEPIHAALPDRDTFLPVLEPHWRTYPPLYLYFPKNSQRAKRIRAVIDFLIEQQMGSF
ncbi:LysR family transcriptional regulator [Novosphingobium umbonatum]|uniref:LysR family transcriptional regulator n=1 Tax=Novosphingobium umbonatum TaxID=1908524 RepID=A0A437N9D9_9SPHN|nr:LysR substrate-binding domain-containing protein [Novosphingobium umbonatum]RVU06452.1 LysR family transcriptional regulator [Novosphingobium umbonatum]